MRNLKKTCLIVDGYNVIINQPSLKKLLKPNQEDARKALSERLQNYAGNKGYDEVIVVFDGQSDGNKAEEVQIHKHFKQVFTTTHQTADAYIEKFVHDFNEVYRNIYVISSDAAVQTQILGSNALRVSVREFIAEEELLNKEAEEIAKEHRRSQHSRDDFGSRLHPSVKEAWDKLRRNEK